MVFLKGDTGPEVYTGAGDIPSRENFEKWVRGALYDPAMPDLEKEPEKALEWLLNKANDNFLSPQEQILLISLLKIFNSDKYQQFQNINNAPKEKRIITLKSLKKEHKDHFGYKVEEIIHGEKSHDGFYKISYVNGKVYIGKGKIERARNSAKENSIENNYIKVKRIEWFQALNEDDAYIKEYLLLEKHGGVENNKNYNERPADKGIIRYSNLPDFIKKYYDDFFN